jgi:hypothetical protein
MFTGKRDFAYARICFVRQKQILINYRLRCASRDPNSTCCRLVTHLLFNMAPRHKRAQNVTAGSEQETSIDSVMAQDENAAGNPPVSKTQKLYEELDAVMANAPTAAKLNTATPAVNPSPGVPEFVTLPRPVFDFEREYDEDAREEMEEERPEEYKKLTDDFNEQAKIYFKKSPTDFPGWTWIISKKAHSMYTKWDIECQKRDQDRFGMHFYNDFSGYGVQEVFENIVCPTFWIRDLLLTLACSFSHSKRNIRRKILPHLIFGPMSKLLPGCFVMVKGIGVLGSVSVAVLRSSEVMSEWKQ